MRIQTVLQALVLGLLATSAAAAGQLVLVTGATGQTGKLVVAELVGQNINVRAMARDPASAQFPAGVSVIQADVTAVASLAPAMQGIDTVVSTIGARFPIGDNGFAAVDWEGTRALIDAAKASGVGHFVLLSAGSAGRDGLPYSLSISPYPWKAKAEAYLKQSGLNYTIVAAGGLRDNPGGEQFVRLAPRSAYESNSISRADLASVLVACAGNPNVFGKTFTVVNDETKAVNDWRSVLATLPAK